MEQIIDGHSKFHRIVVEEGVLPSHILTHTVTVAEDGSLHVEVLGRHLSRETTPALSVLDTLTQNATLKQKVHLIDTLKVCPGNPEPSLLKLADKKGNFYTIRKSLIAKIEGQTIRHVNCAMLIQEGTRCAACSAHRQSLMVKRSRQRTQIQGEHIVSAVNISV